MRIAFHGTTDIRQHIFNIATVPPFDSCRQGLIPDKVFVNLTVLVSKRQFLTLQPRLTTDPTKATDAVRRRVLKLDLGPLRGQNQDSDVVAEANRLRASIREERRKYPFQFYEYERFLLRAAHNINGHIRYLDPPNFLGLGLEGPFPMEFEGYQWNELHPHLLFTYLD